MVRKPDQGKVFNLLFITDQSQIQTVNLHVDQKRLVGYHAYKLAEEKNGVDMIHTSKLLVELQFDCPDAAQMISSLLSELGFTVRQSEINTSYGQLVKGDRVLNWPK